MTKFVVTVENVRSLFDQMSVENFVVRGSGKSNLIISTIMETCGKFALLPAERRCEYVLSFVRARSDRTPAAMVPHVSRILEMASEDGLLFINLMECVDHEIGKLTVEEIEAADLTSHERSNALVWRLSSNRETKRVALLMEGSLSSPIAETLKALEAHSVDASVEEPTPTRAERRAFREQSAAKHGSKVAARFAAKQNHNLKHGLGRRSSRGR